MSGSRQFYSSTVSKETQDWLKTLKPGDKVVRMLGGGPLAIPKEHIVTEVKGAVITISISMEEVMEGKEDIRKIARQLGHELSEKQLNSRPYWTFSRITGAEIDTDLGWDGFTVTGSTITPLKTNDYADKRQGFSKN